MTFYCYWPICCSYVPCGCGECAYELKRNGKVSEFEITHASCFCFQTLRFWIYKWNIYSHEASSSIRFLCMLLVVFSVEFVVGGLVEVAEQFDPMSTLPTSHCMVCSRTPPTKIHQHFLGGFLISIIKIIFLNFFLQNITFYKKSLRAVFRWSIDQFKHNG